MKESITFFICGTPSDKKGFEYKSFDGSKLPGTPSKYLDIFNKRTMDSGRTYCIKPLKIQGKNYSLLTVYQRINPNDSKSSRGAYIAVGAMSPHAVSPDQSISCFNIISVIHGNLTCLRTNNNAFENDFELKEYTFPTLNIDLPIAYIVHKYCNVLSQKDNVITFNDANKSDLFHKINKVYKISIDQHQDQSSLKSPSNNETNIVPLFVINRQQNNTIGKPPLTRSHQHHSELNPTLENQMSYPSNLSDKHNQSWLERHWPNFLKIKRTYSTQVHDENTRKNQWDQFIKIALYVISIPLIAIAIYAGYYLYNNPPVQPISKVNESPGQSISTDEESMRHENNNKSNDIPQSIGNNYGQQQQQHVEKRKKKKKIRAINRVIQ